ncbi:aldehyde dehydrogenase family protein [Alicyclobacillus suci]|uniref:aldehyde dehydrogenase family protein n=1 Tax=Alicyclobacillus suci TaxID=2816080 RepID=UPI001A8F5F3B|nr:aldehyde dehydrogenase family protein [Alicyclobacillus suci]
MKTYLNYINGTWMSSQSGELLDSIDPATGALVAHTQSSTAHDVELAVQTVSDAYTGSDWGSNSHRRANALLKWADAIEARAEVLAALLTSENGKPIREARVEIAGAIDALRYCAGMARNVFGRTFQPAADNFGFIMKEPIGVVAVITPWNWPVLLLFRDLAPCLAAGNGVIIKPAERTGAITAELLALLADIPAFPAGIAALVTGLGTVVGNALVEHPAVDMICFTGSTAVGKVLMQKAAAGVKKVALELGGKSPNLVFEDADLTRAIETSCRSLFMTSGQICMAGSRLLVHESVYEKAVDIAKTFAESLRVGHGRLETTDMGPIISEKQLDKVLHYIEQGRREGRVITGGYRLRGAEYDNGLFIAPTILDNLSPSSCVVQEEIFGPVLVMEKFRTEEEAIRLANITPYGLSAGVWTKDVSRALRVARQVQAGTVWVNGYNKSYAEAESGGYKHSGIGRARGVEGLMEFTETKHVNISI